MVPAGESNVSTQPRQSEYVRLLRLDHHAAVRVTGMLVDSKRMETTEYFAA
jgi:hypothetical protein